MKKILQNMMYIVSFAIVIAVIVALVRTGQTAPTQGEEGGDQTMSEQQGSVQEEGGKTQTDTQTEGQTQSGETEREEQQTKPEEPKEPETGEEPKGDTTILFAGDVLFANAFQAGYDANGVAGVISDELLAEIQAADIFMVNNEFPFSEQGEPMPDKQYTFRCSPSYVKALTEMGVDVVSLANNHVLDYGKAALSDTFSTLDQAGILYGGAGETTERAEQVQIMEVNGRKYGFLAVSRVVPTGDWKVENSAPGVFSCYDDTRLVELVEQAAEECDFLAVYPHWGVEYAAYPEDYQTKIAENCLAAGADIVVGSHTHCLQGAAYLGDKPVFYSLGNFVFGQTIDRSALLKVTVTERGEINWQYLPVYAEGGVTHLAKDAKAKEICNYLAQISPEASVSEDGTVTKKN